MTAAQPITVGRRAARGIVIDDEGRLILIKRTKPGQDPYWTTPGGGIEDSDATVEDALRPELAEELGATADGYQQVFLASDPTDAGVAIQYFFVARLTSLYLAERYGPELASPSVAPTTCTTCRCATTLSTRSTSSRRRSRISSSRIAMRCSSKRAWRCDRKPSSPTLSVTPHHCQASASSTGA